ncbi:MAG: hypothetical protein RIM23_30010 [Coleofasciculus sp. G3-WIS-01]|uniref:hypothetical protein n=1 Tax=Coleofasciculus sp. G3-WIS-01 TaxID=3069528 RepID=UPI00330061CF
MEASAQYEEKVMAAEREFDDALHEAGVEAARVLIEFLKNPSEGEGETRSSFSDKDATIVKVKVALQVLAIANDLPTPPFFIDQSNKS